MTDWLYHLVVDVEEVVGLDGTMVVGVCGIIVMSSKQLTRTSKEFSEPVPKTFIP